MDGYDLTISETQHWDQLLENELNMIVDPAIYRIGQVFLEGAPRVDADAKEARWRAVAKDVAGLVTFFDLIVLHDKLPAFNYADTFGRDLNLNFHDQLGELVNQHDRVLFNVNVEFRAYEEAKQAALEKLAKRVRNGRLTSDATTRAILTALAEMEYRWEPDLRGFENELRNDQAQVRVARFLLGVLLFGGYAQQSGAPHTPSPRRSRLVLREVGLGMAEEVGLGIENLAQATEGELYRELGRRFRGPGEGWRSKELPWTPTFLPWLLKQIDVMHQGPHDLMAEAVKLRKSDAIEQYRKWRADLLTPDNAERQQARERFEEVAQGVARHLGRDDYQELEHTRHWLVGLLPRVIGGGVGAGFGTFLAGPPGAVGGAVLGVLGEEVLRGKAEKLWGWVIDKLPYRSASKILTQSILADYSTRRELTDNLYQVWLSGSSSTVR